MRCLNRRFTGMQLFKSILQLCWYHYMRLTQGRAAGWEFKGELPAGRSRPCGDWDMGAMWECPFLQPLGPPPPQPPPQPTPSAAAGAPASVAQANAGGPALADEAAGGLRAGSGGAACNGDLRGMRGDAAGGAVHVLCVSPYPHSAPDRPTNPCLYWLGELTPDDRFLIEEAQGAPPGQVNETWFCICL